MKAGTRYIRRPKCRAARQRGMSLVELMVGVTIGLFIVAAATLLLGNQLADNRRLVLEMQLQQDLRASMDIITRQIRRAGLWEENDSMQLLPSSSGQPGSFRAARRAIELNGTNDEITFNYWLNPQDQGEDGVWGFKLEGGKVKTKLARGGWQDLTDPGAVKVTRLQFTPVATESEVVACPNLCADGTTACWPKSSVRSFVVTLEAEAASDPLVRRRMQTVARVRNNLPVFNNNSDTQPCP